MKNNGLVAVEKNPSVDVIFYGFRKRHAFIVTAGTHQVFWLVVVIDARHNLFNDWTFIKVGSNVVCCCPDDCYAAVKRLMIGAGPRIQAGTKGEY